MTTGELAPLNRVAAEAVLQASREGRLITQNEVLEALQAGGHVLPEDQNEEAALAAILAEDPRLASFQSLSGRTVYHCPELLSPGYARILDRKGSPVVLMAEEIRANSRDYPRPLPAMFFTGPPFDLTEDEIEHALRAMEADPAYQDISSTFISSSVLYLYSTRYLESGYARFLAQQDQNIAMNP